MTHVELVIVGQTGETRRRIVDGAEYVEAHYDQDETPVVWDVETAGRSNGMGPLGPSVVVVVEGGLRLRFDSAEECRGWLGDIRDAVNAAEQGYLVAAAAARRA